MASSPPYSRPEEQFYQTSPQPGDRSVPPPSSSHGAAQPPPPPPKTLNDADAPGRTASASSWDVGGQQYVPQRTSSRQRDSPSLRGGTTVFSDRPQQYSQYGGYGDGDDLQRSSSAVGVSPNPFGAEPSGMHSYTSQDRAESYEMAGDGDSAAYDRDGVQGLGETRPQYGEGDQPPFPQEGWVPEILLNKSKADLHHILARPDLLGSLLHHPDHRPPILSHSLEQLSIELSRTSDLASQTSALAARLTATRAGTSERLLKVRGLEQQWRKKQQWMESRIEGRMGPRVLHGRLVAAIGEAERMGEGVIVAGLEARDGEMATERDVEDWIQKVKEERRLVWLRKERRARWDEGRVGGWR